MGARENVFQAIREGNAVKMIARFGLLFIMLSIAVLESFAQESVDVEVVARIKEEAYQHSQVYDTLSYLTDVYGPRLGGSRAYQEAAEWAKQRLIGWGVDNARIETFGEDMRGWDVESYSVEMISPRYMNITAMPFGWSDSTDGEVVGEPLLVDVESREALQALSDQLRGKILMSPEIRSESDYPEGQHTDEKLANARSHINPNNIDGLDNSGLSPYVEHLRRRLRQGQSQGDRLQEFLLNEGVAAVIVGSSREPGTLNTPHFRSFNKVGRIKPVPHFVISREQQGRMIRMMERGAKVELKLHLKTSYNTDAANYTNIIAEIPGTDSALREQLVLVGGHFDSNHGSTGAADNGAGSAVTMEVLRIMKTLGVKPRRTIRLVLWGGEEQGHLGSLAYLDKYVGNIFTGEDRGELARISVYFNHDNNGHKIRGILTQGNEPIRPIFERYLEPFHYVGAKWVVVENAGGTDHLGFDALNIPAFEWIQDPEHYFKTQIHTNMDVLDFIAEDTLKHNAAIITTFVYHAAMRDEMMPRKKALE